MPLSDTHATQLRRATGAFGVTVDEPLLAVLGRYLDILLRWNERINLTAVRDTEGIVERHFADSLAVIPHIPAQAATLIDVGTGPGFPGAVVALARPDVAVTLVESNHKKCAFLETLRRELPLPRTVVRSQRVEDVLARPDFSPFDVAVSRATLDLPDWLQLGARLVGPKSGLVLGMEGADLRTLPPGATRHPYPLGSSTRSLILFHVEH